MILLLLWILETVLFWQLILFSAQYIYTILFFDKSNEEPSHCSDGMVDDAGYTREKNSDLKNPLKNQPDVGAPQQQQPATCQSSWADDPENEDLPQEQISFILSRIVQ